MGHIQLTQITQYIRKQTYIGEIILKTELRRTVDNKYNIALTILIFLTSLIGTKILDDNGNENCMLIINFRKLCGANT